jgi:hypothetical protein
MSINEMNPSVMISQYKYPTFCLSVSLLKIKGYVFENEHNICM